MYTNHSKLSDSFCSIEIEVDLNHFAHDQIQADLFMAQVTAAAKALVIKEYGRLYQAPHNLSEPLKQERCDLSDTITLEPKKAEKPSYKPVATSSDDSGFNFRDRLPNNTVDIQSLTIEKAVTENSLVRCPSCGQAHCLAASSGSVIYFMAKNYKTNEFDIVAEYDSVHSDLFIDICMKEDENPIDYFENIRKLPFKKYETLAVENNTEIFCPVCGKSASFIYWKDAFENPLKFFETDNLCDSCGGERVATYIDEAEVLKCEKCGLQVPAKQERINYENITRITEHRPISG